MDASINSITVGRGGGNLSTNTAVGLSALQANISGYNNTAVGYHALLGNTGSNNTAIGYNALAFNTSGVQNTAIGAETLSNNQTGNNNLALGLQSLTANSSGSSNVSIGPGSMYSNTLGSSNVAIGQNALLQHTIGQNNVAIGASAGVDLSGNSHFNTFLGAYTDASSIAITYSNSTALGYKAKIDASNQIVLGGQNASGYYPSVYIPGSYVGIGKYSPSGMYALDVSGNVNATSVNTTSDYRIKENVIQLDSKFIVDNLNPVTYLNNKLGKQDIGLIAHELQEIYPELVNGEKDGEQFQSVNYIGLIPILIKEIQILKERVRMLEERKE
jgi:hypothetical protein